MEPRSAAHPSLLSCAGGMPTCAEPRRPGAGAERVKQLHTGGQDWFFIEGAGYGQRVPACPAWHALEAVRARVLLSPIAALARPRPGRSSQLAVALREAAADARSAWVGPRPLRLALGGHGGAQSRPAGSRNQGGDPASGIVLLRRVRGLAPEPGGQVLAAQELPPALVLRPRRGAVAGRPGQGHVEQLQRGPRRGAGCRGPAWRAREAVSGPRGGSWGVPKAWENSATPHLPPSPLCQAPVEGGPPGVGAPDLHQPSPRMLEVGAPPGMPKGQLQGGPGPGG